MGCVLATMLTLLVGFAAPALGGDDPATSNGPHEPTASPSQVRERRLIREDRPLWRRALALPADALEVTFWPLRQTLFWIERTNAPARIGDLLLHPLGSSTGDARDGGHAE